MAPQRSEASIRADLLKNKQVRELISLVIDGLSGQTYPDVNEEESSAQGLRPYQYQVIKKERTIRLLSLWAGTNSTHVVGELFEKSLDDAPQYEALSWSWGDELPDRYITIRQHGEPDGEPCRFAVPPTLVAALRALRYSNKNRVLWVDAICIDQSSFDEKNKQVPMMADIYGQAIGVCVWIGEENRDSKIALDFIREKVLKLQEFDELCEDAESSHKWRAMLDVMKRPWFSRRWVIQEIALAKSANIYCGIQTISWKDFSDAVQLFVEVETATHRLSDVMKKDPAFFHVPGWFEYVSALGASLLVDATGNLFRKPKPMKLKPAEASEGDASNTALPNGSRSVGGSTTAHMTTTEPGDTSSSSNGANARLQPISKEIAAQPPQHDGKRPSQPHASVTTADANASFTNDVNPIQSTSLPTTDKLTSAVENNFQASQPNCPDSNRAESTKATKPDAAAMATPPRRKDPDLHPLQSLEYLVSSMIGFQATNPHDTIYSLLAIARDTTPVPRLRAEASSPETKDAKRKSKVIKWSRQFSQRKAYLVDYEQPLVDVCQQFIAFCIQQSDPTRALDIICRPWAPTFESLIERQKKKQKGHKELRQIVAREEFDAMPTWIPALSGAPHAMFAHASGEQKMGRQNADTFVGLPDYTQRNYSAAGTKELNPLTLRFRKYGKQHYSMFVYGFICDEVEKVCERSQSGNIPDTWIHEGGWADTSEDPPEELWRTLVADRGKNGRNPPTYYARACKESISKGLASGALNTQELIEHGRCSVIAEFFRRVQSVIWNRSLMRTKAETLGMVSHNVQSDDLVCVLYGCSVPVILRRYKKDLADIADSEETWQTDKVQATITSQRIWRQRRDEKAAKKLKKQQSESQQQATSALSQQDSSHEATSPHAASSGSPSNQSQEQPIIPAVERAESNETSREPDSTTTNGIPDSHTDSAADVEHQIPNGNGDNEDSVERHSTNDASTASTAAAHNDAINGASNEEAYKISRQTTAESREESKEEKTKRLEKEERAKRKAEERTYWYEFIGEAYVYGMMDGEAITYQNENDIHPQTFELR